jgi:hypothetical protein
LKINIRSSDKALGETVRPRTTRRHPDHLDADIGQDGIEGAVNCPAPISEEELELGEVIAELRRQVADLLGGPQANIVDACVRKNCRQVVSVSRTGAGGIRNRRRTRRIVDAPTR